MEGLAEARRGAREDLLDDTCGAVEALSGTSRRGLLELVERSCESTLRTRDEMLEERSRCPLEGVAGSRSGPSTRVSRRLCDLPATSYQSSATDPSGGTADDGWASL